MLTRLRTLSGLELFNIVLFGWFVFVLRVAPVSVANVAGFALFALLLAVGASYWLLKHRQLRVGLAELPGIAVFGWLRRGSEAGWS